MKYAQFKRVLSLLDLLKQPNMKMEASPVWNEIAGELRYIDPLEDIPVAQRPSFITTRQKLIAHANRNADYLPCAQVHYDAIRNAITAALVAPIPPAQTRFPTMKDAELAAILERDLLDAEDAAERGQWKPSIVLAGSVLEAAPYEYLLRNPQWTMDVGARKAIPLKGKGVAKDITSTDLADQWTLKELIDFAVENKLITRYKKEAIHNTLRDPRNLIHPMKEKRGSQPVDEHTETLSLAMVKAVLAELAELPDPK